MRNLKLAFRTLFKTPFVTTIAALSLALGIGANSAIYSIFDQMLRRPLPVPRPKELVNLEAPGPKPGSTSCNDAGSCEVVFSYLMFRDLEKAAPNQTPLVGIAAHRSFTANLAFRGQTITAPGMYVSGGYFPVLEVKPALGRLLTPADDDTPGAHPVVVLSYRYWENALGSDPTVLNQQVAINGQAMTIVGVAAKGFDGTTLTAQPKFFLPISMRTVINRGYRGFQDRTWYWVYAFGRLKPGSSIEQAKAALNAVYRPIIGNVEAPLQDGMSAPTMAKFRAKEVVLTDGRKGQSDVGEEATTPIFMLFAVTGIVLLIACANIANLLLARAANRSMEMAVRLSLGATRGRLLGQLLTESVVLAAIGGVASLIVAHWTLGVITSLLPQQIADTLHFSVSGSSIGFAAALSMGTGLLFGLFPAIHSTRPDLVDTLRAGSGKLSNARAASRFRSSLATAQIALSMALLISAGLFVKSLYLVTKLDLGLKIDNVVTFSLAPSRNGYERARSRAILSQVEQQLAALPGVSGVTVSQVPLIAGSNWGQGVSVQGFKKGPDTDAESRYNAVGPNYFDVVGVEILAGREFTEADAVGGSKVAIVNETFAKKFGLGREAVGKLMSVGNDSLNITIVGLARDSKYSEVRDAIPPLFYVATRQDTTITALNYYVRTTGDPRSALQSIPQIVKQADANLPVEGLKTMPQQIRDNIFLDRMISILSAAFAILATLLASIGLYGVLAYSVAQRTREIGVRMALGADSWTVRKMVLRQVGLMTAIGAVIGIAGAIGLGKAAASMLFGVKGYDPVVLSASAILLAIVALSAGYVPALRASKILPMQALRYE